MEGGSSQGMASEIQIQIASTFRVEVVSHVIL